LRSGNRSTAVKNSISTPSNALAAFSQLTSQPQPSSPEPEERESRSKSNKNKTKQDRVAGSELNTTTKAVKPHGADTSAEQSNKNDNKNDSKVPKVKHSSHFDFTHLNPFDQSAECMGVLMSNPPLCWLFMRPY
jgi:hypothetical protein